MPEKIASLIHELGGKLVEDVDVGKRQHLTFEFGDPEAAWSVYNELVARRPKRHFLGLPVLRPHAYVEMEVEKDRITNIVFVARVRVRGHTETGREFVKAIRKAHQIRAKARARKK